MKITKQQIADYCKVSLDPLANSHSDAWRRYNVILNFVIKMWLLSE